MQVLAIVLLCVLSAVVYGVLHDQVTARVCIEYFTVGHPPLFATASPTLLGLGWGVVATWWVGLLLGVPLALFARVGSRPRRPAASLLRPIGMLMVVMAVCALLAGIAGFVAAQLGAVWLVEPLASRVPQDRHAAFIADLWAHATSYAVAFMGGLVIMAHTWWSRGRPQAGALLVNAPAGARLSKDR
jgi:hypothetical protein